MGTSCPKWFLIQKKQEGGLRDEWLYKEMELQRGVRVEIYYYIHLLGEKALDFNWLV
jgi:hypothetical protein